MEVFFHSIKCISKHVKFNQNYSNTACYGFDSFDGFGDLSDNDKHPFYENENFATSFHVVNKRVEKLLALEK